MTKSKLKTKKSTEKVIGNVLKITAGIVFLSTWLFIVYHMIFNY